MSSAILLKNNEFRFFISSRFLVVFALFMQNTVLSYEVYKITGDALSLGLIGLAEVIPAIGGAFFAGHFVDKNEKRKLYFLCVIEYIFLALFFYAINILKFDFLHPSLVVKLIYAGMFINGFIRSFIGPTSFTLLPLIVKKENLAIAVTWSSTAWLLGSVLGPLLGGLILAYFGLKISLLVIIITMCLVFCCIFFLEKRPVIEQKSISFINSLKEGFNFVFKTEIILAVLSLDLFAVLFGGAEALLPVFAKDILNGGEVAYGWLRAAHGMGSILFLVILAYYPLKKRVGEKLLISVFGFGLCIIAFGLSGNVYLSFFILLIAGMFDAVSVVIRGSILQIKTPEALKGRVASVNTMFVSSSNELGAFESGFMAKMMGTIPSVVFGGLMTLMIVIFVNFKIPNLKKIKLE